MGKYFIKPTGTKKETVVYYITFILLILIYLDVASTIIGVGLLGAEDQNPLLQKSFETIGFSASLFLFFVGLVTITLMGTTLIFLKSKLVRSISYCYIVVVYGFGALIRIAVVIWNTSVIINLI